MTNQITSLIDTFMLEIEKNPGIEILEISKKLEIDVDYIERWVLILEEKEILEVRNIGFKSHLYLKQDSSNEFDFSFFKEEFIQKAKNKNVPYEKLEDVWRKFLGANENLLLDKFREKAKKETKHTDKEVIYAWNNFKKEYKVL